MAFNRDISDPLERIKDFTTSIFDTQEDYWDTTLHSMIHPVSASLNREASTSTSTYTVGPIDRRACNSMHNAHGGAIATLLDLITTIALAPLSRAGAFEFAGVSRTLNCSYLRPIRMDSTVTVVCEAVSLGKRLAAVTAKVVDEAGRVYATCEHHKASVDPPPGDAAPREHKRNTKL